MLKNNVIDWQEQLTVKLAKCFEIMLKIIIVLESAAQVYFHA